MSDETVLQRVLSFLAERFPDRAETLAPSTPLHSEVLLDSLAVMEVVLFLEKEFDLRLERADMDAFGTPESIADLIRRRAA